MGFHANKFAAGTGLLHDKAGKTFFGNAGRYPVVIKDASTQNVLQFQLSAKPSLAAPAQSELSSWMMSHPGISNLTFANNRLSCLISIPKRDSDNAVIQSFSALAALASEYQLVPCCSGCGAEYGYDSLLLDDTPVVLCQSCQAQVRSNMDQMESDAAEVHPNIVGMIISMILGAATVFLLTWGVLQAGYVSYICSFAGLLVGLMLMKKLGRKVTLPAGIIMIVLCLAASCYATVLSFAQDFAKFGMENRAAAEEYCESYENLLETMNSMTDDEIDEMSEEFGADVRTVMNEKRGEYENCQLVLAHQTTGECMRDFKELYRHDLFEAARSEIVQCFIWGVLSVIIGGVAILPKMLLESKGKHSLRVLHA